MSGSSASSSSSKATVAFETRTCPPCPAAQSRNGLGHEALMLPQHPPVAVAKPPQQGRGAFHVAEEEREGSGRELGHGASLAGGHNEHMFYTPTSARGVSGGALQGRAQPRQGDDVQVV